MQTYKNSQSNYSIREETLDGIDYIVAPVTMMVQGVHNGSHGPVFHSAAELGQFPDTYNGIPVTYFHPQNKKGDFISANSLEVYEKHIGRVFNTHMDGEALKAEVYICKSKIKKSVQDNLKQGKLMEVSLGLYVDEEEVEGTYNKEDYKLMAHNYRPDHLAILPGGVGACSIKDGCGIRVNNENSMEDEGLILNQKKEEGLLMVCSFLTNQLSFQDIMDKVYSKLYSMDTRDSAGNWLKSCYLEAVYDDYIVYRERTRSGANGEETTKLFQRGYSLVNDQLEFTNPPVEVVKELKYKQITKSINTMSEKSPCNGLCKESKVDALIVNSKTSWKEEDRGTLMAMEESVLEKLFPIEETKPIQANSAPTQEAPARLSVNEYMESLPEEIREQVTYGLALHADKRVQLKQTIIANSVKDVWNDASLEPFSTDVLQKMASAFKPQPSLQGNLNYAGYGGNSLPKQTVQVNENDILLPAGIELNK